MHCGGGSGRIARGRDRRGFVLLMTLGVMVLAVFMLAGLARRSATSAMVCRGAESEVARRWAVTSMQATLLPRIHWAMEMTERGKQERVKKRSGELEGAAETVTYQHEPVRELRLRVQLAGQAYLLVMTDEQAKLEVNGLLKSGSRGSAESVVAALMSDRRQEGQGELRLRPLQVGSATLGELKLPKVGSYGQIFAEAGPEQLMGEVVGEGLGSAVTCWSDGMVSVRRAEDSVIRAACEKVDRQVVKDFLAIRKKDPYKPMKAMLAELTRASPEELKKLNGILTDQSQCFGLWIVAVGPVRPWYTLAVARTSGDADPEKPHDPWVQTISAMQRMAW
jgi:hypothetical protein